MLSKTDPKCKYQTFCTGHLIIGKDLKCKINKSPKMQKSESRKKLASIKDKREIYN